MIIGLIQVAERTGEITQFAYDRTLQFNHSCQQAQDKNLANEDKFSRENNTELVVP